MRESRILANPKQIQFLNSKANGVIFRAGIRSGKSRVACMKAILNAYRGRTQLIISFTYKSLKDAILISMKQCFKTFGMEQGIDYTINYSDMIVYVGQTPIFLRSGSDPDAIRGIEVSDVFIDEAREFPNNEVYLVAIGRMSENEDGQWHITSSPKGKNWVHELESDKDVEVIHQKTTENAFLPKSYIAKLRSKYSSKFSKQELDGDIVSLSSGVIESSWFDIVDPMSLSGGWRAWDLAVSTKTVSDYTVGLKGQWYNNKFLIQSVVRGKLEYPKIKQLIKEVAKVDGPDTIICIETAGQQKAFYDDLRSDPDMRPYAIKAYRPDSDKLVRAMPWIARAEMGDVRLFRGAWNKNFLDECDEFSSSMTHDHDDQIDALSMCYHYASKQSGIITTKTRY